MQNKISFNGLGAAHVTFMLAQGEAPAVGTPVAMSDAHTVAAAEADEKVVGVVTAVRGDQALVQIAGVCRLPYTGSAPALGWTALAADGSGGVKQSTSGRELLVTEVDTAAGVVEVLM